MIVGIDLGTTNSLIGAMNSGFPVLFADPAGRKLTPSVVYFPEKGEAVVGEEAVVHREQAIFSVKRLMGRRVGEVQSEQNVIGKDGEFVRLRCGERAVSPEEVSALILKKLKADAERELGRYC